MNEIQVRDERPQELLQLAEELINQLHYEGLDSLPQCALPPEVEKIRAGEVACLFQVKELVFDKEEGSRNGLTTVLNALNSCGASCIMLLQCREGRSELYLGAVNKQRYQNPYYLNTIRSLVRTGIEGNLPGTELQEIVSREQIERKFSECLADGFDSQCITAVSCAAEQSEQGQGAAGLEKLLGAAGTCNFSLLILADPIRRGQIQEIRQGWEELGTQLSGLETVSVTCQSGTNRTASVNYSQTFSESLSSSISHTQSHSSTSGWSRGTSSGGTKQSKSPIKSVLMGATAIGASGLAGNPAAGYFAMNAVSSMLGGGSTQTGSSDGQNASETDAESDTVNDTRQQGQSRQAGGGYSAGVSEGVSVQTVTRNHHIQGLSAKLDAYLAWLGRCENYGMFNCCAYVISASASINLLVASQYQALLQGEGQMSQPAAFNTWTQENGARQVRQSLLHFMHPALLKDCVEVTPAMLISSRGLARQMALPQEPVVGVSVMEYASFGREVVRKSPLPAERVARLGTVMHMGKADPSQPVLLDLPSLASHTFIAGTNGSGKSNAVFRLLEELQRASIPFLVIEPAKGEYKHVFGKDEHVFVYGTNRDKTPLLRLNPFWFNKDVNIREHIASLMGVFNASWPMYAAMPSVLHTAVEQAYRLCGWNLETSRCAGEPVFPTVQDVLHMLHTEMEQTAFSQEVKGNYIGALSARLESLCSGIYAELFSGADLGDEQLFEENVLIDLSRAGSGEISAMIMGILLIRLREYRMSGGALNHPLRHVTVLEEAHHLLKRTSTAQSDEGSNLMGKAVEMLSNAIAEMRSYGDGFIIADQSPGLLDASVLRNTNTKIILRLPEGGDRELVGNTIGLTKKQAYELSRLKTGCAVLYQKDWLEAVLCCIDRAAHPEKFYQRPQKADEEERRKAALVHRLCQSLRGREAEPFEGQSAKELLLQCAMSGQCRRRLLTIARTGHTERQQRLQILAELQPVTAAPPLGTDAALEQWRRETIETNDLERTLPPQDASLVLAAHAWQRRDEHPRWKQAAAALGLEAEPAMPGIEAVRGLALALLCGLPPEEPKEQPKMVQNKPKPEQPKMAQNKLKPEQPKMAQKQPKAEQPHQTAASIREWSGLLDGLGGADALLAGKLRQYLQEGRTRQRGEIKPYGVIAFTYTGGSPAWDKAFPLLEKEDIEGWDRQMREHTFCNVKGGRKIHDELLNLTLQFKGAQPGVRKFYYRWRAWSRHREEEPV